MVNRIFSNTSVAAIAAVLILAIVLDGKLYNRLPPQQQIFTLPVHPDISLGTQQRTELEFQHRDGRWHLTQPFIAPVSSTRIDALLDTNNQAQRRYHKDAINAELFDNAVSLRIGAYEYHFGELEPVSQLRYVLAEDHVYLQADIVIPMLRAGHSAFLDLKITDKPTDISIDGNPLNEIQPWFNLQALGFIATQQLLNNATARISINTAASDPKIYHLHSFEGTAALVPDNATYGYLLSPQQSQNLGISHLL